MSPGTATDAPVAVLMVRSAAFSHAACVLFSTLVVLCVTFFAVCEEVCAIRRDFSSDFQFLFFAAHRPAESVNFCTFFGTSCFPGQFARK